MRAARGANTQQSSNYYGNGGTGSRGAGGGY